MVKTLLRKIFGSENDRILKKILPIVPAAAALEDGLRALPDDALRAKTGAFRARLAEGASLDDLMPEAFAVVRETSRRVLGMRHFDVQLVGGAVLHGGRIAEMKTGEGKTLVATLPAYLNALTGKGVHIVTVNDYLAKRDTEWMGPVYRFLGLTVGTIQHDMPDADRRAAYAADITYGTNNEFGFDYLRDNMKFRLEDLVQRPFHFAVVDEVDSILIDEARTPLIISGPTEESTELYFKVDTLVRRFKAETHFKIDEKARAVSLLEEGVAESERYLRVPNLYDLAHMDLVHHINQALKAHYLFKRDVDYMVKDEKVVIVDEFTGRLMPGRRYSDGLHQALEAKERVKIEQEYQTLASITFQNYFRMYQKLSGMTGTAVTEAPEFRHIYGLGVVEVPTNKPLVRIENPDVVYRTAREKWEAVMTEIVEVQAAGRPVLVGTTSIEKSEHLSGLLRKKGVKHVVLNAKYHEQEAGIIAQAGRAGAVTIATNMAGRGVDILLGGSPEALAREQMRRSGLDPAKATPEQADKALQAARRVTEEEHARVVSLGGLHITGTERHEARRIDNQLRGRAGRQGDPGSSRFFLSLEDDLMRIFASERLSGMMARFGMGEGVPIEHAMVSRAIERAQKQVEGHNFSIRKHLLEYDDVMNKQRETVYRQRLDILGGKAMRDYVLELVGQILEWLLDQHANKDKAPEEWDRAALRAAVSAQFGLDVDELGLAWDEITAERLEEALRARLTADYEAKEALLGAERMREFERVILLHIIDNQWKDHLLAMDYLKEGIGLRGYGQRDPLVEYKKESFDMFQAMLDRVEEETVRVLFHVQPQAEDGEAIRRPERREAPRVYAKPAAGSPTAGRADADDVEPPPAAKARQARAAIPGRKRHK